MSALQPSAREVEGVISIAVSPLIAVLAMVIGCSILKDTNSTDYQPLYIAARMGAVGGPIAAFACVLVTFAITPEDEYIDPTDPPEILKFRRALDKLRKFWGIVTPYMIGIGAGPTGSGILRGTHLAHSIPPIAALRAVAVGGIFATPIYYAFGFSLLFIIKSFSREEELEADAKIEAELDMRRSVA